MRARPLFLPSALALGLTFLYAPILLLVLFSFNESRLVTVWGGFSLKWYGALFRNEQMLEAALVSLRIATTSATLATVLGTLAALILVRFGRFRGRLLFTGMITAPLVMPEVITGLSLLLLFVSLETTLGWPSGRGVDTIIIAHTTFCTAYVAVVVQSRLGGLDRSVEEAAMDLGARPLKAFLVITLPMLAPALVSGWLLSFTLSLDDLVIASFVAGPASTTLPMVVFSSVRLGVTPEINALATLLVLVATVTILVAAAVLWRQERGQR
ncbi:ABC transporter permease subunit [Rhodospira trueperi]|uniref:Putrescine transport system permease protein n=1 Tax=Rhodospira trueperi TaxID=69960 RepID=A0A1G6YQI3_9PROT|nr:ABC transporter permease subunit [Rhodospira trueperi]SDD92571.1 putrescine transport system permease protein [Rhodospira trueperi]